MAVVLALDLGVLHRHSREIAARQSLLLSATYIALCFGFGSILFCVPVRYHPQEARMVGVATNRRNVNRLQPSAGSSAWSLSPPPSPYYPGFSAAPEGYESPTGNNKFYSPELSKGLSGTSSLPFRALNATKQVRTVPCIGSSRCSVRRADEGRQRCGKPTPITLLRSPKRTGLHAIPRTERFFCY